MQVKNVYCIKLFFWNCYIFDIKKVKIFFYNFDNYELLIASTWGPTVFEPLACVLDGERDNFNPKNL